ncbi:MAG: GNAT family N-acetyltransferase [Clostridiaceae bacterium]|nr:GNAT family N-acetyltransferase [Clostridiaceae bacterium]
MTALHYRIMDESDIPKIVPLYIEYYNEHEGSCWTEANARRRIHQVWSTEDAYCLVLEENGRAIGFAMGYFVQYDDLIAYNLAEIVIAADRQGRGAGTALMEELERRVKEAGASLIELEAVCDPMHEHFYGKLQFKKVSNLVLMSKFLK